VPLPDAARVLLIEDDEELRNAFRVVLGARGLTIEAAASGEQALDRLAASQEAPTAVIADIGLPGLAGPELVRRLAGAAPASALLVVTGTDDVVVERRCLEAGAAAYLVKPVTGGQLYAALRDACA
jgi:DNA-binding response OmpR family regulator